MVSSLLKLFAYRKGDSVALAQQPKESYRKGWKIAHNDKTPTKKAGFRLKRLAELIVGMTN